MSEKFWLNFWGMLIIAGVVFGCMAMITECRKTEVEHQCGVFSPCKGKK